MAFQVRCPSCSKLYAAEERMIGRKMRCKACASVFAIEAPASEPSLSAASVSGVEYPQVSSSDLTGTRRAEQALPPEPPHSEEDEAPMAEEKPFLKPSVPQDFPGAVVVEAWLPLGLGLISAVWVISQTFGSNDTGQGWVPLLRIGVAALLYLGLVIPLTYRMVRSDFRAMRRVLPPSSGMRTATTFALPAALGYEMWQASGGVGGYFMGLILGIALVAVVYWLLFRLNPQEAANSYAKVAGMFLGSCGAAALIVVGGNALLNRAMMSEHGGSLFKESPLGEPLAWNWQEAPPAPPVKNDRRPVAPQEPEATAPQSKPAAPSVNTAVAKTTEPSTPVAVVPETKVTDTVVAEPVVNPPKQDKPEVFVNPDDDAFIDSIRKNNFPWVKSVARIETQAPFDFTVSSSGQGQYIGVGSCPDGRNGRSILLEPGNAAVPPFQDELEQLNTFGDRYVLTNDGRALIHVKDRAAEVIATGENRRDLVPLEMPNSTAPLKPTLAGMSRGTSFVVRWAAPQATEQFVYRYDYLSRTRLSKALVAKDPFTTPVVCAVSESESSPPFFAWLSQTPGRQPLVKMINLMQQGSAVPRTGALPPDISDVTLYERGEMSFSPDGSMLAMVLEQAGTARVMVWTTSNQPTPVVRLSCKCPTSTELAGLARGPSVRWINRAFLVTYGRNVIGTVKHGMVGVLSEANNLITAEQTTADNKLYISYQLPDTHLHLAAVEFDPKALNDAQVTSTSSH